jgi:hypothetical protein
MTHTKSDSIGKKFFLWRCSERIRPVLYISVALFTAVSPVMAQDGGGAFAISGVVVDATAATATAARGRALAAGQKKALRRLFKRIVIAEDQSRLPALKRAELGELVRDFEVVGEKASAVRYLAKLTIRFKRARVRELLRREGIGFAETISRPVLVLPVFETAGAFALWEPANPWREAWLARPESDGLVPLIHPKGDADDAALIGPEQAMQGDDGRLAAIARRYKAGDVLVVVAGFRTGSAAPSGPFLQVRVSRMGSARGEQTFLDSFKIRKAEEQKATLERAAATISARLQEKWKLDNRLRFDTDNRLTVNISITSLGDWLDIKRRLAKVVFIRRSDLLYLSPKMVELRLKTIGDEKQLTLALAQNDLILERGPTSWLIRRGEGRKNVPASPASQALPGRSGDSGAGGSHDASGGSKLEKTKRIVEKP